MWKKIQNKTYFLSFIQSHDFEINVTDFISIWTASFSEKAFIAQLKNSNEGLLLESDKEYMDNGQYLLSKGIDTLKHSTLEESGDCLLMTLRTMIEYPFSLECKLYKGSNEFFFNKVTQPLLETISDLQKSEHDLIQTLTKKDKEIKAYKRELENKEIIFRHEVTKEFSVEEHKKKYRLYDEIFGSQNIPNFKLLRSTKLPQKPPTQSDVSDNPCIKLEPNGFVPYGSSFIHGLKRTEESDSIKQEVKKSEPKSIKQEPCTPELENHDTQLITPSSSCKQEEVREIRPDQPNRKKKLKLSY